MSVARPLDETYDEAFFETLNQESGSAARLVLPHVFRIVRGVASLVDIGCGAGAWLRVARELGVTDILGLDGAPALDGLLIPEEAFQRTDLEQRLFEGEAPPRRFDLALCLEVAEHLPETRAESFIAEPTRFADVILFSAAIPGQGGTHHLNEQWPGYWERLFAQHGFTPFDVFRPLLWEEAAIPVWYRQNMILYASPAGAERLDLSGLTRWPAPPVRALVHPDLWQGAGEELAARRRAEDPSIRALLMLDKRLKLAEHHAQLLEFERDKAEFDLRAAEGKIAHLEKELTQLRRDLAVVDAALATYYATPAYRLLARLFEWRRRIRERWGPRAWLRRLARLLGHPA
jgi:hypothetical protein